MDKIKSRFYYLIIGIFCMLIWSSCTGKSSMNGNLDGNWQLMKIENRTTGETENCHRLYWAIQLWVIELTDKGDNHFGNYIGRFVYDKDNNTIRIRDFRLRSDESKQASEDQLSHFGIHSSDATFDVVKANGKELILQSEVAVLYFRSF